MPGERLGRLEGEGEEWQLGACPSYGRWASHLALHMDGRHHMWPFLSGESYLHGGQVGDAVHC